MAKILLGLSHNEQDEICDLKKKNYSFYFYLLILWHKTPGEKKGDKNSPCSPVILSSCLQMFSRSRHGLNYLEQRSCQSCEITDATLCSCTSSTYIIIFSEELVRSIMILFLLQLFIAGLKQ